MVGAAGFEPATLGPKPDALPGCATPRRKYYYIRNIKFKSILRLKIKAFLIESAIYLFDDNIM